MVVAILVVLGVLILLWFLLLPGSIGPEQEPVVDELRGRNYAHRGLHTQDKSVPENSLAAFRAAVKAGYGMELDVQLTKDGEVVVFHDDDLQRVCGVQGRVDSYTMEELAGMRLEDTEEKIPTFREVLELVGGRVPLIVELKMGPRNKLLCRKTSALLKGYRGVYCVESFDPRIVGWFHKNQPEMVRGQLAAPAKHLSAGVLGVLVGWLFSNFLARPHFIAYKIGPMPPTVRYARGIAMKVAWTARPTDNAYEIERKNDAVIFEYYLPEPVYRVYDEDE